MSFLVVLNKAFLCQWSSVVPAKTFLAVPEDEKTKCTEEMEPVAQHCEISDPTPYDHQERYEENVMLPQDATESEPDASEGTLIAKSPETSLFEVNSPKPSDVPIQFEMDQGGLPVISMPF